MPINYSVGKIIYSESSSITDNWDNIKKYIWEIFPEFFQQSLYFLDRRIPFIINKQSSEVMEIIEDNENKIPTVIEPKNKVKDTTIKVPIDKYWNMFDNNKNKGYFKN